MSSEINKSKYRNAILYFVKYCNNQYLGATKLNKLLYYLDFISFRDRKRSVTGDIYIHKQYGPIPAKVDEILTDLHQSQHLAIDRIAYKESDTFEYKILKEPQPSKFDSYEKNLLKNIADEFTLWSTEKIVNQTHLEAPWFYSKPFDVVDYNYSKNIEFFPKVGK